MVQALEKSAGMGFALGQVVYWREAQRFIPVSIATLTAGGKTKPLLYGKGSRGMNACSPIGMCGGR